MQNREVDTRIYQWLTRTNKEQREKWLLHLRTNLEDTTYILRCNNNSGILTLGINAGNHRIYILNSSCQWESMPSEHFRYPYGSLHTLTAIEIGYLWGSLEFYDHN